MLSLVGLLFSLVIAKGVRDAVIRRALDGFAEGLVSVPLTDALSMTLTRDFLTEGEIGRLKRVASPKLKTSQVLRPGGKSAAKSSIRTSSSAFLVGFWIDPIVAVVKRKAAILAKVPLSHIENIQVVRYREGEYYGPHLDAMNFERFPGEAKKGQRSATVLVYLNDIANGSGKTSFPKLGLEVSPQRGQALYFRNTASDGSINPQSLHAGLPVHGEGMVKWALNIWIRDRALPWNHR